MNSLKKKDIFVSKNFFKNRFFNSQFSKLCLGPIKGKKNLRKYFFFFKKYINFLFFFYSLKTQVFVCLCSFLFTDQSRKIGLSPLKLNRFLVKTNVVYLQKFTQSYCSVGVISILNNLRELKNILYLIDKNENIFPIFVFFFGKIILKSNFFALKQYFADDKNALQAYFFYFLFLQETL